MMFVKSKGRFDPETSMEAWRALNDLRAVISELDWPKWWEHLTPKIEQMCQQIPEWVEAEMDLAPRSVPVNICEAHGILDQSASTGERTQ